MIRPTIALTLTLGVCGCMSAPPAPSKKPVGPTFEQKMARMLRLEDQRLLHDPPPPPPPLQPPPKRGQKTVRVVAEPLPETADLVKLLDDEDARVRRRAALAVGRVGLSAGVDPLLRLLSDPEPEVRQAAAFGLGLLADRRARDPLIASLADSSSLVQASAAEALGLIGDAAAAVPIGQLVSQIIDSGALTQLPDDADDRRDTRAAVCRLALTALVRLKAFDQLAAAVLDPSGQPRLRWWPVAFALERLEDRRGAQALLTLAGETGPFTRALAIKGLGALKERAAVPLLAPLVADADHAVAFEAIHALGRIGDPAGASPLLPLVRNARADPQLRAEAILSAGSLKVPGIIVNVTDAIADSVPAVRAAALRSLALLDRDTFVTILSGLDPDPSWQVRESLASILGGLPRAIAEPRLTQMLSDEDQRVIPSVLASLAKLGDPDAGRIALDRLKADDPAVRAAAARVLGDLKPPDAGSALADAYAFGQRDAIYIARAAALTAVAKYGASTAVPVLKTALTDKDWAVRVRAAALLADLDPSTDAQNAIRPAPTRLSAAAYAAPAMVAPPVSTHVYLDTDRGTIQIELAVIDAPLAVDNFVALARTGFFNGLSVHRVVPDFVIQTGDPRGDGEGGPGYTIRDELNELPYLRGTVGMALDWADTGGSQFFITHAPQPHLDAKYTVFGHVVGGMEVVDAMQQGDVIRRVRVWDGQTMTDDRQ